MPSGAHEALSLSFSNRGNILASGDERGNIHLWDFATGAPQSRRALRGRSARLNRLMFSPTRDQLASCGDDGIIKTWDIKTLESHDLDGPHNVHIRSTAYSPNGKWLASGGLNGAVTQWDLSSGVSYPLCNHGPEVSAIVYSADGRWLICGDRDGHIYVMDQKIGVELHHFKSATGINTLVYGSHQHTIVSGNQSGFIEWWEIPS